MTLTANKEDGTDAAAMSNGGVDSAGAESEDALRRRYLTVLKFYRENEGRSAQLAYADRVALVALAQQAAHGAVSAQPPERLPQLGALDVIGKDRRWGGCQDQDCRGWREKSNVWRISTMSEGSSPCLQASLLLYGPSELTAFPF